MIRELVLLPGMDGTGNLFKAFREALPERLQTTTARYPTDVYLSYSQLVDLVQSIVPPNDPYVILAESFSTPLAIQCARMNPSNLKGLVICAGFAASPIRGWLRILAFILAPLLLRMKLPNFAVKHWLVGHDADKSLQADVRSAIASVRPSVLSSRAQAVLGCDSRSDLRRIGVPILYMQAKQDRIVDASSLEDIRQRRPDASVIALDGPHLLLQSKPIQAAEAVMQFLQQLA